jgi:hypothetical protein
MGIVIDRPKMSIFSKIYSAFISALTKLFFLLEFFLFIRLFLKFLGASAISLAVDYIYQGSHVLVSPFYFIFPDIYFKGRLLEIATISAMLGYLLGFFVLMKILRLFSKD